MTPVFAQAEQPRLRTYGDIASACRWYCALRQFWSVETNLLLFSLKMESKSAWKCALDDRVSVCAVCVLFG